MDKFIKKHTKLAIIIGSVLLLLFLIIIFILIDKYKTTGYLISIILMMLIPISLQDFKDKKMQDEIKSLINEIEKKNMVIAELRFEKSNKKENNINAPMFDLRNTSCKNNYKNFHAMLKNASNNIVYGIETVSFEVLSVSKVIAKCNKVIIYMSNFLSNGEEIEIEFNIKESITKKVKDSNVINKICFVWKFKCVDTYQKVQYYKATLELDNINNFSSGVWNVEKVG